MPAASLLAPCPNPSLSLPGWPRVAAPTQADFGSRKVQLAPQDLVIGLSEGKGAERHRLRRGRAEEEGERGSGEARRGDINRTIKVGSGEA